MSDRLRIVVVGAGGMGRAWLTAVEASADTDLVAVADLDLDVARTAAGAVGRPDLPVGTDAVALAAQTGAHAVVNVTVPAAHHPVATAALFAGLPVLGEKPVADTVAKALSLAAASQVTGQLFMVSQSRRWNPQLFALRDMVEDLGAIGTLTTEFFRAPHFGGFREEMAHPLLVDMAIHAFDSARFLLGAEPVSVYCEAYNPPWSWYDGAAAASAVFAMEGGIRYAYTGSWCSPGADTSWNGAWRVSGEKGTALWDGDHEPGLHADVDAAARPRSPHSGIDGALHVFVDALRTGAVPMGEVHENVLSLAMVEAAVRSAETGERVLLDDVLADAHAEALRDETCPEVRDALAAWPSVREVLTTRPAAH
ncbi:Gfo/Idh/MocA family protein [Pseudonocardia nigra]|uniref:Gfo/Idh/MocA family protein n=1 Tax=Pseudonocardia nigra TaxID=1921578 RepID=UPI001C5DD2E4|nr:Gfo/Idh/MocA family oxidoreductase [Pseudonocardia nigra]